MKIKEMKRRDWRRITERNYVARIVERDGRRVAESLLSIRKVLEPLWVQSGSQRIVIADDGYAWVQIAEEGAPVWLTSMFNREGQLVQLYFDITAGNRFGDPENPTFLDMYLDVVLTPSGEIDVLDRDELDGALARGEISREAWDKAIADCEALLAWLETHAPDVMRRCETVYRELCR